MEMSNRKNYKLAIFDVDGTMLDTSEGLLASTVYTINALGYPLPEQSVLESFIGPRIQDSLSRVFGLKGDALNQAAKMFRDHYKAGNALLAKPYDGIYDVLDLLKEQGIHIAVATNKRQDFVDGLMEKYAFLPYVEAVFGTDFAGKLTKTDLILSCMEKLRIGEKENVLMIGDSAYDAKAAQEAGIDFIGVTYGFDFKTPEEVSAWKNAGCAGSLMELKHFFRETEEVIR